MHPLQIGQLAHDDAHLCPGSSPLRHKSLVVAGLRSAKPPAAITASQSLPLSANLSQMSFQYDPNCPSMVLPASNFSWCTLALIECLNMANSRGPPAGRASACCVVQELNNHAGCPSTGWLSTLPFSIVNRAWSSESTSSKLRPKRRRSSRLTSTGTCEASRNRLARRCSRLPAVHHTNLRRDAMQISSAGIFKRAPGLEVTAGLNASPKRR
mmetsp:Transcript_88641/g.248017  ORF Transcript_88641/g.248017 Transcript_88641/m.248017 type:complete len:212 (-) Transcript_88641:929-1564(-)